MRYAPLNYDDPLIEIIENALFVIKNLEFTDLSPQEQRTVKRNAASVFAKLEARSDKITASNLATMYHAVGNFRFFLKDNVELYREIFPSPELSLPAYVKMLEASERALEAWASEIGYGLRPVFD